MLAGLPHVERINAPSAGYQLKKMTDAITCHVLNATTIGAGHAVYLSQAGFIPFLKILSDASLHLRMGML